MKSTDVLVIGGSAAGMVVALSGKGAYPDKRFTMVKKQDVVMVPCGIPYIFGTLAGSEQNIMPVDKMMSQAGVESVVGEVVSIDIPKKVATFADGSTIGFDKLVLATGSTPILPKWLEGREKENVFVVPKEKEYLDQMKAKLSACKHVVVVGAGFIGVELSDEFKKTGGHVTLIEKLPHILALAFDVELSDKMTTLLQQRGIEVKTGVGVAKIGGETKVESVTLDNGDVIPADAVVVSVGYEPNSKLAKDAGLDIDENNFIDVDEYMRTHTPDVFAVGDCAQKRDFVTRRRVPTMLASTACAEARIAGRNLYQLHTVKTFSGTIAIYATAIGDVGFGTAGLTEARAKAEQIDVVTGIFEGIDRHPGTLPGVQKQTVKLIAARNSGVIIGGEVIGGPSAGELTNVIGLIIQNRMTVNSLLIAQIGTHPCLTASPAGYPLIKAAEIMEKRMRDRT